MSLFNIHLDTLTSIPTANIKNYNANDHDIALFFSNLVF